MILHLETCLNKILFEPSSSNQNCSGLSSYFLCEQVQLQNMLTSKYIAHFLAEVSTWQKKLSTADQVIGIWMEVQRTWSHLESIFIGSEDIRNQLPEDSKRFDGIDTDFKVSLPLTLKHQKKAPDKVSAKFVKMFHPSCIILRIQ